MRTLVAVLWAVYLSECLARWRAGSVLFREEERWCFRPAERPDIELLDGGLGLACLSPAPWRVAFRVGGPDDDIAAAHDLFSRVKHAAAPLVVAATLLFAVLPVGATVLVLSERTLSLLVPWALLSGVAWVLALAAFFRTHRAVHGRWPALETSISTVLSPLALIRSPAAVCLDAAARTHPIAAAAALCDDESFVAVARRWLFDHPDDAALVARAAEARALGAAIEAEPTRVEPGVVCFCPRCHQAYQAGAIGCVDCVDVPLRYFRVD